MRPSPDSLIATFIDPAWFSLLDVVLVPVECERRLAGVGPIQRLEGKQSEEEQYISLVLLTQVPFFHDTAYLWEGEWLLHRALSL